MIRRDRPPRLGLALVRLFGRDRREEAIGDLVEAWQRRQQTGRAGARRAFWRDVWSLLVLRRRSSPPLDGFGDRRTQGALTMLHDIRYALRLLRRQPLVGGLAVGTLAFGIAAAVAIFALCHRVLLDPLPYPSPDRIVSIEGVGFGIVAGHVIVPTSLTAQPELAAVSLYGSGGLNVGGDSAAFRLRGAGVSSTFFRALGVQPLRGRAFSSAEELATAPVVVIGFDLWQRAFAGAADVVGSAIRVNGRSYTVLGVMPRGFAFPDDAELWVPLFSEPQMYGAAAAPAFIARLAPGVRLADAREAIARMNRDLRQRHPQFNPSAPDVVSLQDRLVSGVRPTLLFLAGLVSLLLIATCANVSGLLLSRLRLRERELQLRAALGAGRGRLARQLLVECFTLTGIGAAAGIGLALAALRAVVAVVPDVVPAGGALGLDAGFVAWSLGVVLVCGTLLAIAPVAAAGRRTAALALREHATVAGGPGWMRGALVAAQVACALVLLTATSAAIAVVVRLAHVDIGFGNDRAEVFEVTLPRARYADAASISRVSRDLERTIASSPAVAAAGLSSLAPDSREMAVGVALAREGQSIDLSGSGNRYATLLAATTGYFPAMGIRPTAGRTLVDADQTASSRSVVLSETAARSLWSDPRDAVGRRVLINMFGRKPDLWNVVGVVPDVRLRGVAGTGEWQIYVPLAANPPYGSVSIAVAARSAAELPELAAEVQRRVAAVDPDLPLYNALFVRDVRGRYLSKERATLAITGGFGAATIVLCAVGLFGVLSQVVTQRTREMGIRLALGAEPSRLRRSVVLSGARLVAADMVIGVVASSAAARLIAHFVPALDPPTALNMVVDAAILVGVALVAAWVPARRASSVDPLVALRAE